MKYVKILSSLAAIAAALASFAGNASATVFTAPAGTTYTGPVSLESEGYVPIDNPIAAIPCVSNAGGTVGQHGAGVTAIAVLSNLSFTNCTNSWHVTVVSPGWLEFHALGGGRATVTSTGATIEATRFGITCRYATSSTDIGELTPASFSTTHATLDIKGALPFHGGSGLCGSGATTWTGSYKVTTPTGLSIS
jgi:hypothetical protein